MRLFFDILLQFVGLKARRPIPAEAPAPSALELVHDRLRSGVKIEELSDAELRELSNDESSHSAAWTAIAASHVLQEHYAAERERTRPLREARSRLENGATVADLNDEQVLAIRYDPDTSRADPALWKLAFDEVIFRFRARSAPPVEDATESEYCEVCGGDLGDQPIDLGGGKVACDQVCADEFSEPSFPATVEAALFGDAGVVTEKPLIQVSSEMRVQCLRAIEIWGQSDQLAQSMGECGEFLGAFGKYIATVGRHFQGRDPQLVDVTDEAADVLILMMQIRELVGPEFFDAVLSRKFAKFKSKLEQTPVNRSDLTPRPQRCEAQTHFPSLEDVMEGATSGETHLEIALRLLNEGAYFEELTLKQLEALASSPDAGLARTARTELNARQDSPGPTAPTYTQEQERWNLGR